jgi:hypothetical protein
MKLMVQELQRQLEEIEETKGHLRAKKTITLKLPSFMYLQVQRPRILLQRHQNHHLDDKIHSTSRFLGKMAQTARQVSAKVRQSYFLFFVMDFNWLLSNYLFICFLSKLFFANFLFYFFITSKTTLYGTFYG